VANAVKLKLIMLLWGSVGSAGWLLVRGSGCWLVRWVSWLDSGCAAGA
jgi:hypothetical protein